MVEELRIEEPKVEVKPVSQPEEPQPKPEEDILTRVSQVRKETPKEPEVESKFNINDLDAEIEKITDPALKTQMIGLKKSLISGENKKYEELANLRKTYEAKLNESSGWTPERLQAELTKPDFVKAAQAIMGENKVPDNMNYDDYSALSDADKAKLESLRKEVDTLKQERQNAFIQQQHAQLKAKYASYDQNIMDETLRGLQSGKLQITLEDIYKAINYETAVKRAYEIAMEDKQEQNKERVAGATYSIGRNIAQPSTVERQNGESIQEFLHRSYNEHSKKT